MKLNEEAYKIMIERFGKDNIISLATIYEGVNKNTIILCIKLTDGLLLSHGTRYDIDFE